LPTGASLPTAVYMACREQPGRDRGGGFAKMAKVFRGWREF
jgi:hypothetical protein